MNAAPMPSTSSWECGGAYQEGHRVPFGKPITLPAPFDLTLATDRF